MDLARMVVRGFGGSLQFDPRDRLILARWLLAHDTIDFTTKNKRVLANAGPGNRAVLCIVVHDLSITVLYLVACAFGPWLAQNGD